MKHVLAAAMPLLLTGVVAAQTAPVNLPATPSTVVWGYYSAKAKPVLTVHSGDTVHIQTLSTCGSTERLEEEGVAAADIPTYNADIYREVKDKGPGGHILTGPVDIAEAEPGDVLEVQILKIDLDISFACNGFAAGRGFLPNDYPYGRIGKSSRSTARGWWPGSHRASRSLCTPSSAAWVLPRPLPRAASTARRRGCTPATWTTRNWWRARRSTSRYMPKERSSKLATAMPARATARSTSPQWRLS